MATSKIAHTWEGKGLRQIDLLNTDERKAVMGMFESPRTFKAQHVKSDASEFMKYAAKNGLIDNADQIMTVDIPEVTLKTMGYEVVHALDGRLEVIGKDDDQPLRGTIPPGSRTVAQIAHDYIRGLAAQGILPQYPATARAQKPVTVSREFSEFLRATGELVVAVPRDAEGDSIYVWPARHDEHLNEALRNYQLATLGVNAPDGGKLGEIIAWKTPKQHQVYQAGFADQWRMMDSLREIILNSANAMSSGAFADFKAGGEIANGLKAFQAAMQYLAEDAVDAVPRQRTVAEMIQVSSRMASVDLYLETAPVQEVLVRQMVNDATDLSTMIGNDLAEMVKKHEHAQNQNYRMDIDANSGLG